MSQTYVQYGCGLCAPEGWLNFDASPTLQLQRMPVLSIIGKRMGPVFPAGARFGDIVRGLPLPEKSCDAVYCSHVLEHLVLDDLRTALANTFRVLKPGGRFRLVMPDLNASARHYLANVDANQPDAAHKFMDETLLGRHRRLRGLLGAMRSWIGNSYHMWLWDYPAIEMELKNAGFTEIRRAQFRDTGDPMFEKVEEPGRWNGQLGVDCKRPD